MGVTMSCRSSSIAHRNNSRCCIRRRSSRGGVPPRGYRTRSPSARPPGFPRTRWLVAFASLQPLYLEIAPQPAAGVRLIPTAVPTAAGAVVVVAFAAVVAVRIPVGVAVVVAAGIATAVVGPAVPFVFAARIGEAASQQASQQASR